MSLVIESIQKAVRRSSALDLEGLRRRAEASRTPVKLATDAALEDRRRFLLQTSESTADAEDAFERIIQGNELQDVNYLPRGSRAARSVGRVWIRQPNGTIEGYGTGFLIGERVLLTNNHVLLSAEMARRSEVEFEYEHGEDGEPLAGVKFSLEPGALFYTSKELDFTVVGVGARAVNAERELAEFGRLPLYGGTGKAVEGEWLTIIQHPRGEMKQICVRDNQLLKRGDDVVWYSTDTQEGSSGSPVFNNDWLVVALHHCGVPATKDGRWQTVDGRDYDPRVNRPEDVKWVANEGIRVSRIVETLQRDLGAHPLIESVLNIHPSELTSQPATTTTVADAAGISAVAAPPPAVPLTMAAAIAASAPVFAIPSSSASSPAIALPATVSPTPAKPTATPAMNSSLPFPAASALAGRQFTLSFDAAGNPVLTPSAGGGASTESFMAAAEKAAAAAKAKPKVAAKAKPKGVAFTFDDDYDKRAGFDVDFLSKGLEKSVKVAAKDKSKYRVNLPKMTAGMAASAVKLLEPEGTKEVVLNYQGMSLVMHAKRRFAIYSAANVDFAGRWALSSKRVWKYDPRIPIDAQVGPEGYEHNLFDKGHLTRQEDMEYGVAMKDAMQSAADTCHWTNCTLQHAKFNETQEWWQGLEKHVLENSVEEDAKGFRAQIITGPVFSDKDPVFPILPGIQVPMKFWKVAVAVTSSGKLFAVAYLVDQTPVIKQFGVTEAAGETPFEPYKLFQLPISELEDMIHLKFTYGPNAKPLSECDPLKNGTPPMLDADQDGKDDRKESLSTESVRETPEGWVDLTRNAPYFGK
ncbi:DNA/RNA non-specific endonuclease [Prosthecobacter sp.]|uniref:DNA/RNA non-specific endonuclease n=1 Tax=Prosthecobacter sp. TaxID=1965333 RepID=UPI0037852E3B